jgi:diaminopimelate epimerase
MMTYGNKKTLPFTKMHGLGNDFIVLDAVNQALSIDAPTLRLLCDRRLGIGADQVLIVSPPKRSGDFNYSIYNADGSRAAHCGNGARCVASFIYDQRLSPKRTLHLEMGENMIETTRHETGMVTVLMGRATFVDDFLYDNVMFMGVEIGNPHAITLEGLPEEPFVHISEHLQKDARFSGINVSMMRATDHHNLYVKTFERGVGLTPACGSAATACAFLAMERNLVIAPVTVHMPGGDVTVDWQDNQLTLTGPAVRVYDGVWFYP